MLTWQIFSPDGPYAPAAFNRMAVMIQIVNASPTLSGAAFAIQQGQRETVRRSVLGRRMGLPPDHQAVRLVADIWTVVFAAAFAGMGTPGDDPIEAAILCERLIVDVRRVHPDLAALACRFGAERATPRRRAVGIAITLT